MGYDVVDVADIAGEGPGGAVRFVRRRLRVEAFGINWIELSPGETGREHDEHDTGQEEVYVIIRGSGTMTVDGDRVALQPGSTLRVDPESTRVPVAGADGLVFVAIGSPRDGAYEPRGHF